MLTLTFIRDTSFTHLPTATFESRQNTPKKLSTPTSNSKRTVRSGEKRERLSYRKGDESSASKSSVPEFERQPKYNLPRSNSKAHEQKYELRSEKDSRPPISGTFLALPQLSPIKRIQVHSAHRKLSS